MKPVAWMVGAAAAAWLAAIALFGVDTGYELLLGMIAPLAMAVATRVAVERAYTRNPARVAGVILVGFVGKMLFFGGYVALALGVLAVRPAPFIVSFTGFFIGLHLVEAFYLQRLFAESR